MSKTPIEWTERTWNPVRGCSPVSPGCAHCYAERHGGRFCGPGRPFDGFVQLGKNGQPGPHWTGKVELVEHMLNVPYSVRKPTTWFVNSMSDLFHEALPFESIDRVMTAMIAANWHTYQILTKRSKRMLEYTRSGRQDRGHGPDRANVHLEERIWLGVSVEDQPRADERIPDLMATPAEVRFLSCEPLLGPVDLRPWLIESGMAGTCFDIDHNRWHELGTCPHCSPALDWVIVGGESGPGARPFDIRWARSIVRQCQAAGVPVFVKQMGAAPTCSQDPIHEGRPFKLKDHKGGDMDEWPGDLRVRQMPEVVERPRFIR